MDLENALKEAKAGCFLEEGPWTVPAYESCTAIAGEITLKDGREAQVTITVQTQKDDWL